MYPTLPLGLSFTSALTTLNASKHFIGLVCQGPVTSSMKNIIAN